MTPGNGETPDNAGNKGGWFSRVKARFGFGGKDAEEAPDVAETLPVDPAADAAAEAEVTAAAVAEALTPEVLPEPEAPLAPPEPPASLPSPYLREPVVPPSHVPPAPVDPGILAAEAEAARVLPVTPDEVPAEAADGPAATAAEPAAATDETAAEEAAPAGSWLDRFKGRFGLGLGTPKAMQAEPEVGLPSETDDTVEAVVNEIAEEKKSWFATLATRLAATRDGLVNKVTRLAKGKTKIDEELLDELEEILLTSDVGPKTTDEILTFLRQKAKSERFYPDEVLPALREYLASRLAEGAEPITADRNGLTIFLMVGVNGVGKTTTTGKIAAKFRLNDYKVLLAAADTFRAAAIDQLQVWGQRAGVDVIRHGEGGDAAAVVYDALKAAKARQAQILIVDTAGRLHTKHNLMEELAKIRRIIDREAPEAKVESLLVLDATTGQNGLRQAEVFGKATPLTGVILTKLDGTAKGGVVFSIKETLGLPIRLMGVGEGLEDLREFDPQLFVEALFTQPEDVAQS